MLRLPILLLTIPLFGASPGPGGVLSRLTIASFPGSIQALATDASGNIYAAGTTSSTNFPTRNAAQRTFGESRILRSTDLGVTWTRMGLPPSDVSVVVPDPVDSQVIFAAGATGIFKSTDGGQSWTTVHQFQATESFNNALVIDPGNHLRLAALVAPASALLRSFDGGNTWTAGTCPPPGCGNSLVADASGSGALLVISPSLQISRDWGATFQRIFPNGAGSPTVATFDPSNPGWIYVDQSAGVFGTLSLSKDFGKTWSMKASPSSGFSAMAGLQVDPAQPNVLVAATPDAFYKSSDGANSWTRQSGPSGSSAFSPETHAPFALLNRTCNAKGGLFAIGSSFGATFHIDFSPDDGATWLTPQLTGVTNVAMGPGCTAYASRPASTDTFVAKLSSDGVVQWATYWGGSDQDTPVALAVDSEGNCYVSGTTTSPDFPTTEPPIGVPGQNQAFTTKFSPNGSVLFSAVLGGEGANTATAMALDLDGNVYLGGSTNSLQFPVTAGVLDTSPTPYSYNGFLAKFSSTGKLVYATYLGQTGVGAVLVDANEQVILAGTGVTPGLDQPPPPGPSGAFVVKLDSAATQAVSGAYLQPVSAGATLTSLAMDTKGNLLVFGSVTGFSFTASPGAYSAPMSPSSCTSHMEFGEAGTAFLLKLDGVSFQTVYTALLNAPCGIETGAIALGPSGDVALTMVTGAGLPLKNPLVAGPVCLFTSSAVAKISADGSTLQFATYLDGCGIPSLAFAHDGSILAGAADAVLKLSVTNVAPISLDRITNAFSGDATAVSAGGLYTLSGSGFQPSPIDLRINPSQNLPDELGGVKVLFDGMAASILQVAPGRVIVAAPERLVRLKPRSARPTLTSVQISYDGLLSDPVWMPMANSAPGVLTTGFLNPQPSADFPDGYVENQDGTVNSAPNPAAVGSTITIFATGMGGTNRPVAPGSIATSAAISPDTPVWSSWRMYSPNADRSPEQVYSMPGFVSAMFRIPLQVPASALNTGGPRAGLGLTLQFAPEHAPLNTVVVGVYVK